MVQPRLLTPTASVLAYFGAELRRLRTEEGLTQEQLAQQINYSAGLVGLVETARRMPSADFAQRCDDALDTGGALTRLWPLVRKETTPAAWFADYLELETEASEIHTYEPHIVAGLLQTEEYARAVVEAARPTFSPEEVGSRVTLRMTRQEILFGEQPPSVWAIIDESALHREVGGHTTMRGQLDRLLQLGELPAVTIQVMPFAVGVDPALGNKFVVLRFPEKTDVIYLEELTTSLYLRDNLDEVTHYTMIFEHLRATALPEKTSLGLIAERMKEWA